MRAGALRQIDPPPLFYARSTSTHVPRVRAVMGKPKLQLIPSAPGYEIELTRESIFPRCTRSKSTLDQASVYGALFPKYLQLVTIPKEDVKHSDSLPPDPGPASDWVDPSSLRVTPCCEELRGAGVGQILSDGSSLLYKEPDRALLISPMETEVLCSRNRDFSQVFKKLIDTSFDPCQWYIPNLLQLRLAFQTCKSVFPSGVYWSATKQSSFYSFAIDFNDDGKDPFIHVVDHRIFSLHVRAFREVHLP